jgi:hypothetical protein
MLPTLTGMLVQTDHLAIGHWIIPFVSSLTGGGVNVDRGLLESGMVMQGYAFSHCVLSLWRRTR